MTGVNTGNWVRETGIAGKGGGRRHRYNGAASNVGWHGLGWGILDHPQANRKIQ